MRSHVFITPRLINYGPRSSTTLGGVAKNIGAAKVLVVTDGFLVRSGILQPVFDSLEEHNIVFTVFDNIRQEPDLSNVQECLALVKDSSADVLVGCGGGSAIDLAKAVSVVQHDAEELRAYMGMNKVPRPGLPVVAIPTTAGTGSEATSVTVITDAVNDVKMMIGSPYLLPEAAIVDPCLTLQLPKSITAATGLDALTHAIEAYVSRKAQPLTDALALDAIRKISRGLPVAYDHPNNLEARTEVMLGALQAGMAFSNASVGLVHGMSRPVGALFHVAHGVSNAALLGPVMEFSLEGNPEKYADIALALGVDAGINALETAREGTRSVRQLISRLDIPTLAGLGVAENKLDEYAEKMADDALASGSPGNNPRLAAKNEIVQLYYASL